MWAADTLFLGNDLLAWLLLALGGALLVARMVRKATGLDVRSQQLDELEKIPPEQVVHSVVELEKCPTRHRTFFKITVTVNKFSVLVRRAASGRQVQSST